MTGLLVLAPNPDGGGLCYLLDGVPVEHDEELELLLPNERWFRGFYAWSGNPAQRPRLRVELAGDNTFTMNDRRPMGGLTIPPGAILRRVDPR